MLGDNALLAAGVWALYLADSLVWLRPEQVLVTFRRGRAWRVALPSVAWQLAGRSPVVPNPFTPHRPQRVLRWLPSLGSDTLVEPGFESPAQSALRETYVPLTALVAVLLVALPLALLRHASDRVVLWLALDVYVLVALLLLSVWWHRASWQMPLKSWATLAFAALACPPFALNLVRRLCARLPVQPANTVMVLARDLPPSRLPAVATQLSALARELETRVDECSPEAQALTAVLEQLQPLQENARD